MSDYTITQLPDVNAIVKDLIESEVRDKLDEWAKEQALAAAKAMGGPAALADNVKLDFEMAEEVISLPSVNVGTRKNSFSLDLPEVKMETQTVAKLHIPESYMERERLPFNHRHCKVRWKIRKIAFGIKTKVPELVCWETPAYADVPKVRMVLKEVKTDIPVVTMRTKTVSYDEPTLSAGTAQIKIQAPRVKRVSFDIEGIAKDFVPGGSIVAELLLLVQKANTFRETLKRKVSDAIETAVGPALRGLKDYVDEINTAIERVQGRYSEIIGELDHMAGDHSEEIRRKNEELSSQLQPLVKKLEPILDAIKNLDKARESALGLVDGIKLL